MRLATIHNLRFMNQLIDRLRAGMADLDAVVAAVLSSSKYRTVAPEFVSAGRGGGTRQAPEAERRDQGDQEPAASGGGRVPERAAGLRRVAGSAAAAASDADERREVCRALMQTHASSRERLPILDEFYRETLAEIAPVRSVLDVACGLNPLAIPFMPLAEGATYTACDIYTDLADFLQSSVSAARRERLGAGAGRDADDPASSTSIWR